MAILSLSFNIYINKLTRKNRDLNAPLHAKISKLNYEFLNPISKDDLKLYNFIGLIKKYFDILVKSYTDNFKKLADEKQAKFYE